MINSIWRLNLKPVLDINQDIEEFEYMLGMIEETDRLQSVAPALGFS